MIRTATSGHLLTVRVNPGPVPVGHAALFDCLGSQQGRFSVETKRMVASVVADSRPHLPNSPTGSARKGDGGEGIKASATDSPASVVAQHVFSN